MFNVNDEVVLKEPYRGLNHWSEGGNNNWFVTDKDGTKTYTLCRVDPQGPDYDTDCPEMIIAQADADKYFEAA